MPYCRITFLALVAAQLLDSTSALYLPFKAQRGEGTVLSRRAAFSATTGNTSLANLLNVAYTANLTVGGSQFTVALDTGSSDLNIFGAVPNAQDTTTSVMTTFAAGLTVGQDNGECVISFADVEFAGYTVPQQIFNHGPAVNTTLGLLGLGPTSGSLLSLTFQADNTDSTMSGDTLLDRIFQQNTSAPNFMSFLLGRQEQPNLVSMALAANGDFTIGEIIPGMEAIMNMPQLPVLTASNAAEQHWTVLLDGATGSNGQPITFAPSAVAGTPSGKLVAVLDSGLALPQVSQEIADGLYKNVPGAQLQNVSQLGMIYTLPCNAAINASFTFQNQMYPIHPLDLNFDVGVGSSGGCVGAFQPIQPAALQALNGQADIILGSSFLRNVYLLMNFGDFVDATADAKMMPFVQMLSTTNAAKATAEFNTAQGKSGALSSLGNVPRGVVLAVALAAAALVGLAV